MTISGVPIGKHEMGSDSRERPALFYPLIPHPMQTIFWISVGLLVVAGIAVGHTVRKHNKMFKDNEDPVPYDMPGNYDNVQDSERPYYEYFN